MSGSVKAWIERLPSRHFVPGSLLIIAAPLVATVWTAPLVDLGMGALALVGAGASAWAARYRQQLASLPLELATTALSGQVNGVTVYRFRAWLGRGRRVRSPSLALSFQPTDGDVVELTPFVPAKTVVGPFTVLARDPAGACAGPGRFTLEVKVDENGKEWTATSSWERDSVVEGHFAPGFEQVGGRLRWAHDTWNSPASP